ncbi:unnamed protein product [Penicillium salamii]|nr:unnamed protein product [Penicillium salamii]CAG8057248.1 unnamed protein product [Penicillium salamii]
MLNALLFITMPLTAAKKWRSRDDASSIYSRPPETPKSTLPLDKSLHRLETRHDRPDINSLDHQIALARGYTMALEMTQLSVAVLDIIDASQEFIIQCHYDPDLKIAGNLQIWQQIHGLRDALERSRSREASAEREWKRKCNIRPSWGPSTCWI